ncbi:MAG: septation protein A [Legionellales bacterium]|jgi:intracellular septation protein|nr:septation protein A [Legionellales bacterium]
MHFLFDFIPIALFFIFFKLYDIYVATAVAMLASTLQIAYMWYLTKKIDKTPCITLVTMLVLGGATLFFHNELFIKWKPTVIYWVISLFILGNRILTNTSSSHKLFKDKVLLDNRHWNTIDKFTAVFFAFMGFLNITIAYNYDTNTWVHFKLFGALGLMLLFCLAVSCYITKYAEEIESNEQ